MMANTLIHVFMYYYYYAASIGQSVWFKKYITTGQIIQFIFSFLVSTPYVYYHMQGECSGFNAFVFSMFVNGSFLVLFIRFYQKSYRSIKKKE